MSHATRDIGRGEGGLAPRHPWSASRVAAVTKRRQAIDTGHCPPTAQQVDAERRRRELKCAYAEPSDALLADLERLAIVEREASVRAGALALIVAIRRNRSKSQRELIGLTARRRRGWTVGISDGARACAGSATH